MILQNMKRWPVCRFRFLFAPLPKRAEHGSRAAPQQTRSADAPKFVLIPRTFYRRLFDCALAALVQPIDPIELFQLRLEAFGKRQQVMRVVHCIFQHPRRERTPRPIRLLGPFAEFDIEVLSYQSGQTKFADPEQARSNHRVENALRDKIQTAAEQSQIEIRSVQNNFFSLQRSTQRRQIDIGEWIEHIIPSRQADLEQTKLLSITMEAIRFGIDRHAID